MQSEPQAQPARLAFCARSVSALLFSRPACSQGPGRYGAAVSGGVLGVVGSSARANCRPECPAAACPRARQTTRHPPAAPTSPARRRAPAAPTPRGLRQSTGSSAAGAACRAGPPTAAGAGPAPGSAAAGSAPPAAAGGGAGRAGGERRGVPAEPASAQSCTQETGRPLSHPAPTRMMRKTLRAVATLACTFFTSPGCPAATNMAAYWQGAVGGEGGKRVGALGGTTATPASTGEPRQPRLALQPGACTHLHRSQQLVAAIRLVQELLEQLQGGTAGQRWAGSGRRRRQQLTAARLLQVTGASRRCCRSPCVACTTPGCEPGTPGSRGRAACSKSEPQVRREPPGSRQRLRRTLACVFRSAMVAQTLGQRAEWT